MCRRPAETRRAVCASAPRALSWHLCSIASSDTFDLSRSSRLSPVFQQCYHGQPLVALCSRLSWAPSLLIADRWPRSWLLPWRHGAVLGWSRWSLEESSLDTADACISYCFSWWMIPWFPSGHRWTSPHPFHLFIHVFFDSHNNSAFVSWGPSAAASNAPES